ncbi:MAG: hypothetical protein KGI08_05430 [Thaumarchaeota archaeon]|nr:hypothetical protein [Nitrososphaerota archaeon]MDE1867134.1 hypothetical protein [Nitrososphaerota archaeon]
MNLDLQDFVLIIGLTTLMNAAANVPIMNKMRISICKEITDLKIRLGVIEKTEGHSSKDL